MQYKLDEPLHGTIGTQKYQCNIQWRNGKFISDEPVSGGGKDEGPDPYSLLLSSLATCTLITLRMYIDRKGWDIPSIAVNTNMYQQTKDEKTVTIIDCDIFFVTFIAEEQKTRLLEIAKRCPISKILEGDVKVRDFVFRDNETKKINYANDEITVVWKPEFCQHSTRCFTQLPEVFDPKIKEWINPDGAPAKKIEHQVKQCPSGALTFFYNKDESKEAISSDDTI
jgi:putative redox protein